MADYTFSIKTPAELAGVERAIARFEQLRGEAKANGKDFAELDQKLIAAKASVQAYQAAIAATAAPTAKAADDSARYAKSLEEMQNASHEARAEEAQRQIDLRNTTGSITAAGAAQDTAAEKTKLVAGHSKDLKKVIQELGREFPIAGFALKAFASPIGAALTIATGFFVAIKRQIDETNQKLDEMEAAAREPLANFAESFRKAQLEADSSAASFVEKLNAVAAAAGGISEKTEAAVRGINRLATAQTAVNDAAQGRALAEVDTAQELGTERGGISPREAILRRKLIQDFYRRKNDEAKAAAEDATRAARVQELSGLEQQRGQIQNVVINDPVRLKAELDQKQQQAAKAKELRNKLQPEVATAEQALATAEAELARLQRLDQINGPRFANDPGFAEKFQPEVDKARAEFDRVTRLKNSYATIEMQSADAAAAITRFIAQVDEAKKAYASLSERINEKKKALEDLDAQIGLDRKTRAITQPLKQQQDDFEARREIIRQDDQDRQKAEQENKRKAAEADRQIRPHADFNRDARSHRQLDVSSNSNGDGEAAAAFEKYHRQNLAVLIQLIEKSSQDFADVRSRARDRENA